MSMLYDGPIFEAFDVETTLNGNEDVGLAHPMHPDNRIVYAGLTGGAYTNIVHDGPSGLFDQLRTQHPETVYCGHNFSFDLLVCVSTMF